MKRSDPVAFLKDLERPEAYPAPHPTAIHLITTHISWVFITDHDVWKVKRPVDYGFVDYTTLEVVSRLRWKFWRGFRSSIT
jgi:hypothetical protein